MWPWDWVIAAGRGISGLSQKAVDWVNSLISSLTAWVVSALNSIWSTIGSIWSDISHVWDNVVSFVGSIAANVANSIAHFAMQVADWINQGLSAIWDYARHTYDWVLGQINRLSSYIDTVIQDVFRWVQESIWNPLVQMYEGMKNWFVTSFNRIWQYIQHPELLVNLIAGYLFSMWLTLVKRYAVPLVRWIIRAMRGMAGEVFDLLENVLTNIL